MDLHIHSCLSPCAEETMVPPAIVERALSCGLDGIAITDHNSARNAQAVAEAGSRAGLPVILGMEVTSSEEIHLLCYFRRLDDLFCMEELVRARLEGKNDPEYFGTQVVVDDTGAEVDRSEELLIGATSLTIDELVDQVHRLRGVAVASHVDRPSFSLLSQLGTVPEGLRLDALEVSPLQGEEFAIEGGLPVIRSSDAHTPQQIGAASTVYRIECPTAEELGLSLAGARGRRVLH